MYIALITKSGKEIKINLKDIVKIPKGDKVVRVKLSKEK